MDNYVKTLFGLVGGLLLFAGIMFTGITPLDVKSQMLDPVVQINKNCSATVVSSTPEHGSFLITADHCVSGAKKFKINIKANFSGFNSVEPDFDVVATDPVNDLAIIHTQAYGLTYALIATQKPTEGDQTWTVGFPLGLARLLSTGFYGTDEVIGPMNHQSSSSLIAGGNSGGGLFVVEDGAYKLVGVTSKGMINSMIPQMFTPIGRYSDLQPIHDIVNKWVPEFKED